MIKVKLRDIVDSTSDLTTIARTPMPPNKALRWMWVIKHVQEILDVYTKAKGDKPVDKLMLEEEVTLPLEKLPMDSLEGDISPGMLLTLSYILEVPDDPTSMAS